MAELRWGAATDSGMVRDANEDAYVTEPQVFAVADGMGGHRAGEVASEIASKTLRERLSGGAANLDVVVAALVEANAAIFQAAHSNAAQQGMGTTVTALVVMSATEGGAEQLALVNVGDSRTYLHRNGELTRATVDHSYVQELVATGHITETEARTHPRRNIVTRALGIEPTVRVDAWVLPLVRGDRYILCSDGLVDEVPDHEIADIADGMPDPQRAADELVAMANRHGGRDNTTVIVVDVLDGVDGAAQLASEAAAAAADGSDDDATTVLDTTAVLPATAIPAAVTSSTGDTGADVDATLVMEDDTTPMDASFVEQPPAARNRRRITPKLFLGLLAIAAVLALAITLIAVAVTDDDSPAPTTTVPTSVEDTTVTTDPATTDVTTTDVPTTDPASGRTSVASTPSTRPPPTTAAP